MRHSHHASDDRGPVEGHPDHDLPFAEAPLRDGRHDHPYLLRQRVGQLDLASDLRHFSAVAPCGQKEESHHEEQRGEADQEAGHRTSGPGRWIRRATTVCPPGVMLSSGGGLGESQFGERGYDQLARHRGPECAILTGAIPPDSSTDPASPPIALPRVRGANRGRGTVDQRLGSRGEAPMASSDQCSSCRVRPAPGSHPPPGTLGVDDWVRGRAANAPRAGRR
jgi:hypothetical protein